MKTKLFAITLCLLSASIFSGCAQKYISVPCVIDVPPRLYDNAKCTGGDIEIAKCAAQKKEALEADYEILLEKAGKCK